MTPLYCPLVPAVLERFRWTGLAKLPPTWAILVAAAVVLLLYILKLRRRQVEVPFSPLWARLLRDKEPTSFWRHLKRLFSMLLQLVVLALLLGAVADPRDRTELKTGRHILVLLDTSASMQAVDGPAAPGEEGKGPRSRIAVAKEEIRRLIKKKRRNDNMMLVRMDGQVTPVTSWTQDAAVLEKALNETQAAETSADIGRGLRFAADTLREAREPILVLVGDGHYDEEQLRCVFWGSAPPKDFDCEIDTSSQDAGSPARPRPGAMTPGAPGGMAPGAPGGMAPAAPGGMAPGAPGVTAPAAPVGMAPGAPGGMAPAAPGGMAPGAPGVTALAAPVGMAPGAPGAMAPEPPARLQAPRPEVLAAERFIDPIAMGNIAVHAILVGKSSRNLGIVAFNARRNPSDRFSHQLFVQVRNYQNTAARVHLLVSTGSVLPETVPLDIGPGETAQYIKKGLPAAGEQMTGRLVPAAGSGALDDFPLDDVAYALLPKREKARLLLVSVGNLYLEGVLLLDEENISYTRIMPAAYTPEVAKRYDAVIFDDFTPQELPPAGNFMLFDPRGPASPVKILRRVKDPEIWWPQSDKDRRHPIMDFIRVKDLRTLESSVFETEQGDHPLVRLDERGDVYALARRSGARRLVVVGFSTRQTNWVLRVGFPVFLLNSIAWFAGENTRLIHTYRTGETWTLPLETGGLAVRVTDPKKRTFTVPVKDGQVSFYGRHIGFHVITTERGQQLQIAGNLANPRESDITPRTALTLGYGAIGRKLVPPELKADTVRSRISARTVIFTVLLVGVGLVLLGFGLYGGRAAALWVFVGLLLLAGATLLVAFALELRPWTGFLLAVVILLLAEWLTYNRRVTV